MKLDVYKHFGTEFLTGAGVDHGIRSMTTRCRGWRKNIYAGQATLHGSIKKSAAKSFGLSAFLRRTLA